MNPGLFNNLSPTGPLLINQRHLKNLLEKKSTQGHDDRIASTFSYLRRRGRFSLLTSVSKVQMRSVDDFLLSSFGVGVVVRSFAKMMRFDLSCCCGATEETCSCYCTCCEKQCQTTIRPFCHSPQIPLHISYSASRSTLSTNRS